MDKLQENMTKQYLSARSLHPYACKECGSVFYEEEYAACAATDTEGAFRPSLFIKVLVSLLCATVLLAGIFLYTMRQELSLLEAQVKESAVQLSEKEALLATLTKGHDEAKAQNAFFDSHIALVLEGKAVYHTYQCASFRNSHLPHAIYTVPEAQEKGYAPCKNCHP